MTTVPDPVGPGGTAEPDRLAHIRTELVRAGTAPDGPRVAAAVRSVPGLRSDAERWHLARTAGHAVTGAGVLQPLLEDPQVTDVLVNGTDERSEEHTSELQSRGHLVCRLLLEKKKQTDK